ncbi:MAG: hypothetical protein K2O18_07695, partial [Oscillospiraceae bacterium]|nr:hypothetical protein [Oscillospiraceae bacterium]
MELLHPASFASSVASAGDNLEKIARLVGKYNKDGKEEFLNACRQLDYKTANRLLDQTVAKLSGFDSVPVALTMFSEKFPQLPELSKEISKALTEREKAEVLSRHADKICSIMKGAEE